MRGPHFLFPVQAASKVFRGKFLALLDEAGVVPLAAPGVAAGSLMVFILAMGYYITPALVGGGSDQMLSYFVATYTTDTGNWGLAAALGLLMLVTTMALYVVAHRLSGGRVMAVH